MKWLTKINFSHALNRKGFLSDVEPILDSAGELHLKNQLTPVNNI